MNIDDYLIQSFGHDTEQYGGFNEADHPRESVSHDGKLPGEFAPKAGQYPELRGEQRYKDWISASYGHKGRHHPTSFLTGTSSGPIRAAAKENPGLGLLVTPWTQSYISHIDDYSHVAIDNGVYSEFTGKRPFSHEQFMNTLNSVVDSGNAEKVLFAVAPDVVGDWQGTIDRSAPYLGLIREMGLPVAFAAQDGIENHIDKIPWGKIDVLFIGGSTAWKLGHNPIDGNPLVPSQAEMREAGANYRFYDLLREAENQGVRVHVGRVSSQSRMDICNEGYGADSVDGTKIAFAPDKNLPMVLDWVNSTHPEGTRDPDPDPDEYDGRYDSTDPEVWANLLAKEIRALRKARIKAEDDRQGKLFEQYSNQGDCNVFQEKDGNSTCNVQTKEVYGVTDGWSEPNYKEARKALNFSKPEEFAKHWGKSTISHGEALELVTQNTPPSRRNEIPNLLENMFGESNEMHVSDFYRKNEFHKPASKLKRKYEGLVETLRDSNTANFKSPRGHNYILHQSVRQGKGDEGDWQLSSFNTGMAPTGHRNFKTKEHAIADAIGYKLNDDDWPGGSSSYELDWHDKSGEIAPFSVDHHLITQYSSDSEWEYSPLVKNWASNEFENDDHANNFHDWFKGSHVHSFGTPTKVYHGSPDVRGILSTGKFNDNPVRGAVHFFTDSHPTAHSYSKKPAWDYQASEPGVIPAYLSLKNPMVIDGAGKRWRETEKHVEAAREAGHDGLIIKNSKDHYENNEHVKPATVYAVFDKSNIKSAMKGEMQSRVFDGKVHNRPHPKAELIGGGPNSGAFSPDSDNIFLAPQQYAAPRMSQIEGRPNRIDYAGGGTPELGHEVVGDFYGIDDIGVISDIKHGTPFPYGVKYPDNDEIHYYAGKHLMRPSRQAGLFGESFEPAKYDDKDRKEILPQAPKPQVKSTVKPVIPLEGQKDLFSVDSRLSDCSTDTLTDRFRTQFSKGR